MTNHSDISHILGGHATQQHKPGIKPAGSHTRTSQGTKPARHNALASQATKPVGHNALVTQGSKPTGHPEFAGHEPTGQEDHIEIHEIVEHEPDPDVAAYVENTHTPIQIPDDLQNMGVEATHVVQYPAIQAVHVPLEDEQIVEGLKKPVDSAFRWLAEFCLYFLHKAHIRLKIAHGKAERILIK